MKPQPHHHCPRSICCDTTKALDVSTAPQHDHRSETPTQPQLDTTPLARGGLMGPRRRYFWRRAPKSSRRAPSHALAVRRVVGPRGRREGGERARGESLGRRRRGRRRGGALATAR
eukprot:2760786-Prymnesium_polylepis.1